MSLFLRRRMLIAKCKKKKSKNLFDINSYGEFVDSKKHTYIDLSSYNIGDVLTISANAEYNFKISNLSGGTATLQKLGTSMTFTVTEKIKSTPQLYIISVKTWEPETKENLMDKEVQLEYGNEATPYEPYN